MEKSQALDNFIRAGKEAGLARPRIYNIAQGSEDGDPLSTMRDDLSPELSRELTPKRIETLFKKLSGGSGQSIDVQALGGAIYKYGTKENPKQPTETEFELFLVTVKLIEQAFLRGSLLDLDSLDLSTLVFLTNRLAKIPEFQKHGTTFENNSLGPVIGQVDTFEGRYYKTVEDELEVLKEEYTDLRSQWGAAINP